MTEDPEALGLRGFALAGARVLKETHPSVVFTSGRRSAVDQARAMAQNVVRNRRWIAQTYRATPVSRACQAWVDAHPQAKNVPQLTAGLIEVFDRLPDVELCRISRHLTGDAFDVQPVTTDADAIKATIRGLLGLDKFLEREGGLVRWHAQFRAPDTPRRLA